MISFPKRFYNLFIVKQSGLFDPDYYLLTNPDVRRADIDPLKHFMNFGWREGRNPNNWFDMAFYLEQNQDVKKNDINSLVHYIRYGKKEGRPPNPFYFYPQIKPAANQPKTGTDEKIDAPTDEVEIASKPRLFTPSRLVEAIKNNSRSSEFIISLSHDNYLEVTLGGVQVYITREQKKYNDANIRYLHFFPYKTIEHLADEDQPFVAGINLDGKHLGIGETQTIISALNDLDSFELKEINIHHSMGFSITFLNEILKLNKHCGNFWLHDYFSICPSYHLLRNDIEYCGAPDIRSNACMICKYKDQRARQSPKFLDLFEKNKFVLISPSDYTRTFWQSKFPIEMSEYFIKPPVKLKWLEKSREKREKGPLRIGFLGLPLPKKGWNTWIKLVNNQDLIKKYEFFHFSSMLGSPGTYKRIHTEPTPEQPNIMIEYLRQQQIDVAFLWSVVPETFSFTLHEALAAGCFIITNKLSGNIQNYIKNHPQYGLVLDNEHELDELLSNNNLQRLVQDFQKDGRPRAELIKFEEKGPI